MTSATSNIGRIVSLILVYVCCCCCFYTKFVMCMTVNTRAHWIPFVSVHVCARVKESSARVCERA